MLLCVCRLGKDLDTAFVILMQEIQNEPCLEDGVCVADVMIFAEEGAS